MWVRQVLPRTLWRFVGESSIGMVVSTVICYCPRPRYVPSHAQSNIVATNATNSTPCPPRLLETMVLRTRFDWICEHFSQFSSCFSVALWTGAHDLTGFSRRRRCFGACGDPRGPLRGGVLVFFWFFRVDQGPFLLAAYVYYCFLSFCKLWRVPQVSCLDGEGGKRMQVSSTAIIMVDYDDAVWSNCWRPQRCSFPTDTAVLVISLGWCLRCDSTVLGGS